MDFTKALPLLLSGRRMARRAWVVDGKWVAYRTGYMDGEGIPVNGNTATAFGVPEGTPIRFRPYFQMCEKDGTVRTWNKGDDDILGTDWYEVEGIGNLDPANRDVTRLDADQDVVGTSVPLAHSGPFAGDDEPRGCAIPGAV
ncbi:MW1434 family type I TA system toxin [Streptomyces sp. NPDC088739]|uniref:Thoeris anti-defense Tad2 family protein n=1 Tax=Streptomyces sp. NPDC088739 TaxID=3365882 RepID=UPI003817189F